MSDMAIIVAGPRRLRSTVTVFGFGRTLFRNDLLFLRGLFYGVVGISVSRRVVGVVDSRC